MFDDLCLMARGECVYMGPWADASEWFESIGHSIPVNANPAEFLVDLVSVDTSSDAKQRESETRLASLASAWAKRAKENSNAGTSEVGDAGLKNEGQKGVVVAKRAGVSAQFLMLLKRSWRQVRRDGATNKIRLSTSMNSALVFGSIFWRMGLTQTSIQDRLGLLQVSAINAAMVSFFYFRTVWAIVPTSFLLTGCAHEDSHGVYVREGHR
jgi:hypothetical protein